MCFALHGFSITYRERFRIEAHSVADAVALGRDIAGPVLLLELADCAGGGAANDSIALVRELLECKAGTYAAPPQSDSP